MKKPYYIDFSQEHFEGRYGDLFQEYEIYLSNRISALQLVKKFQFSGEFRY